MSPSITVAVGAVIVRNGSLLLIRRANDPGAGRWSLPGGRVEAGERLHEALVRELREEIGVEAQIGGLVGIVERCGRDHHFLIVDYRATVDPEARPVAGDDAADVAWVPLPVLGEWDLVDGLAEFLSEHSIT